MCEVSVSGESPKTLRQLPFYKISTPGNHYFSTFGLNTKICAVKIQSFLVRFNLYVHRFYLVITVTWTWSSLKLKKIRRQKDVVLWDAFQKILHPLTETFIRSIANQTYNGNSIRFCFEKNLTKAMNDVR